jgi:hypothetical protein
MSLTDSKFREARHFFSHLEEALRDYSTHAAHVPHTLDCGVSFTDNATNNIYLIWKTTHYTSVMIKGIAK